MATSLKVSELDFDEIKKNLKDFFKQQSEFTDYDFEGSGLSVLIDTLAYNTHYNAFYLNMAVNEVFIDSAVKRESVVSLAKLLNYTPRSAKGAIAKLNITVNGVQGFPGVLNIDRYTAFTTVIDSKTYTFYNLEPAAIIPSAGIYSYEGLEVHEGIFVVNKYNVGEGPGPAQKFVIQNRNIDTDTLKVSIQPSSTSTQSTAYAKFTKDITELNPDAEVYFLEQNAFGFYEVYFGDGVLGKILSAGNQVTLEYLVSNGSVANVSDKIPQTFSIGTSIQGYTDVSITVTQKSSGASSEETIDEIRFNAVRNATAQNRLVTTVDYSNFLIANFPYIEQAVVWGGEDNEPPKYGKVFISIQPKPNQVLTTQRKTTILNEINKRRMLGMQTEFVDPEIIYIVIQDIAKYNPNITNDSSTDIENAIRIAVNNFFNENITKFGDDFSASKLIGAIDNSKESIISNSMIPILEKRFNPTAGVAFSQNFKLGNKIQPEALSSTYFFFNSLGEVIQSKLIDVQNATLTVVTGTYRRTGQIVTVSTPLAPHGLVAGETVTVNFSGSALDGNYLIDSVPTPRTLQLITEESGVDYGTISIIEQRTGTIKVVTTRDNRILNNNVGKIQYDSGVVVIDSLNVYGFLIDQTDLRLYLRLTRDSEDIFASKNQVLRLDTDSANEAVNRLAGISLSTIPVPK
jgi:hypothetical protein